MSKNLVLEELRVRRLAVISGFKGGKFSNEQNIRIRYAQSKRINIMYGSLLCRLELFSLCSSHGTMLDWVQYLRTGWITAMWKCRSCWGGTPALLSCFRKYSPLLALPVIYATLFTISGTEKKQKEKKKRKIKQATKVITKNPLN